MKAVWTGLRYSDYSRLNKEHIREDEIHIRPKKTEGKGNNKVVVPISSRLNKVLKKYNYIPPHFISGNITEFNKTIRRLAEQATINSDIVITKKIAGKTSETTYKKFPLVSSHTCRRTFCTLKFLDQMPAQVIMKFSGHKTERAFMRYLKIDAELAAKQYRISSSKIKLLLSKISVVSFLLYKCIRVYSDIFVTQLYNS